MGFRGTLVWKFGDCFITGFPNKPGSFPDVFGAPRLGFRGAPVWVLEVHSLGILGRARLGHLATRRRRRPETPTGGPARGHPQRARASRVAVQSGREAVLKIITDFLASFKEFQGVASNLPYPGHFGSVFPETSPIERSRQTGSTPAISAPDPAFSGGPVRDGPAGPNFFQNPLFSKMVQKSYNFRTVAGNRGRPRAIAKCPEGDSQAPQGDSEAFCIRSRGLRRFFGPWGLRL